MLKFVAHGRRVVTLAREHGWLPGARYTNLRDVRHVEFSGIGFLDIDWKRYCFETHLAAARLVRPYLTVARDVEDAGQLDRVLREADLLACHATQVVVVPKDIALEGRLEAAIPPEFVLGFSVPTRYGGTRIDPAAFTRPVHLLGGRPDVQRRLAERMNVTSLDCNRFTLDAAYGDYFDGETFRPHPIGGYEACLRASLRNIGRLWDDYGVADATAAEKDTEQPMHLHG